MKHIDVKQIDDWVDLPPNGINDWVDLPVGEEISVGESGIRGLAQGASLGYSDEATGGIEALYEKLKGNPDTIEALYKKSRDEARNNNKRAQEANPGSFGVGQVGGAIGTGLMTGGTGVLGGMALGAASGLGNSEADLLEGQVGGAIRDVGIGGALGGAIGGGAKALGNLGSKLGPKVTSGLEEIATNPMLSKVANIQPQAQMSGIASNLVQKYAGDVPGMKGVADAIGNTAGRAAAYKIPGVNLVQGASDAAKATQKAASITLEHIIPKMGKFAKPLQEAATRGSQSLAATDFILSQNNEEYRVQKRKIQDENK